MAFLTMIGSRAKIPETVIRAIIRGDLPEYTQHPDVQALQRSQYVAAPSNVLGMNAIFPSIYAIYLVEKTTREPPTVRDLEKIIAEVKRTTGNPSSLNLARDLAERIRGEHPQATLAGGLVDVGFSADRANRIAQHYSSNEVMQDFRAAAVTLFGEDTYVLKGFIVCRLRKYNYCGLAEVIISRLAQSYTSRGGGFNRAIAGQSITGARYLSPIAWDQIGVMPPNGILLEESRGIQRALQNIATEMMPRHQREIVCAREREVRDQLTAEYEERHRERESLVDDEEQGQEQEDEEEEQEEQDDAESAAEPAVGYSSEIEFSS
ncbi:hypothetical protein VE03_03854 [Pseudogymnoascus sp. 23342-1-I1]|nr:hypothetical protein VE03_03854 [Pseudogymnoascus sp. 23342-1-I1]